MRTAHTEHVELVSALNELNELQEYRLRRQESLQAIENELKADQSQEKPPLKKMKKSSSGNLLIISCMICYYVNAGLHDNSSKDENKDHNHYIADSGDIYARSTKQRTPRPG